MLASTAPQIASNAVNLSSGPRLTTAAWPLAARAQPGEWMRHIGVLLPFPADNAEAQARMVAFLQGLALSGWTDGAN